MAKIGYWSCLICFLVGYSIVSFEQGDGFWCRWALDGKGRKRATMVGCDRENKELEGDGFGFSRDGDGGDEFRGKIDGFW